LYVDSAIFTPTISNHIKFFFLPTSKKKKNHAFRVEKITFFRFEKRNHIL
jgi:hypothetical protein